MCVTLLCKKKANVAIWGHAFDKIVPCKTKILKLKEKIILNGRSIKPKVPICMKLETIPDCENKAKFSFTSHCGQFQWIFKNIYRIIHADPRQSWFSYWKIASAKQQFCEDSAA